MDDLPIDAIGFADFQARQGEVFRLCSTGENDSKTAQLTLVEVTATQRRTQEDPEDSRARYESFSLIFNGPDDRVFPQRMYLLEHQALGRFELFLVPIDKISGAFQYEAVFNRRMPTGSTSGVDSIPSAGGDPPPQGR